MEEFSQHYFAHLPLDEILRRRFSDSYGAVLAAWQFMQQRERRSGQGARSSIPIWKQDGWQSTHSVLFILHPNIPFLIDSVRIAINQREMGVHTIHHSIFQMERDRNGKLKKMYSAGAKGAKGARPKP